MTVTNITGAYSTHGESWESIDWKQAQREVKKLQVRIAKATREGRWNKVKSLQWLLTHSFSAKCMAVRRITSNRGGHTPGVDGKVLGTPEEKHREVLALKRRNYRPLPLRRVYIPKSNGKKRPLGIPVMHCRAMQALHTLALLPVAESTADWNSYGFRPERSTADAIEKLFTGLAKKRAPQWVLEGDIKGCFDNISHDWMIKHITVDPVILEKWLKCGYMDKKELFPTEKGSPQGGIISPTLANMVLDGMEDAIGKAFGSFKLDGHTRRQTKRGIQFVRYADDFVIIGKSKEILEKEVKPLVVEFLNQRGLELSAEKTKITNVYDGFDFLGQNIRKYRMGKTNDKLLIKPSAKNIKAFLTGIKDTIKDMGSFKQADLIRKLNPKIVGWSNYHRHVVSKEVFNKVDYTIWLALWCWAKRRHPKKGRKWINHRYFHPVKGVARCFSCQVKNKKETFTVALKTASATPIRRHIKIRGPAHPFDPTYEAYFEKRISMKMRHNKEGRSKVVSLWKKQQGRCPECGECITIATDWYIHYLEKRSAGGGKNLDNLVLLHPECHMKGHRYGFRMVSPVGSNKSPV